MKVFGNTFTPREYKKMKKIEKIVIEKMSRYSQACVS
jgi:hypothetical protein